jgi:hypothetical protein
MGTSDFVETALSKHEAYDERLLRDLAAHRLSHTALRIHQDRSRRFGHFARTAPRGLGKGQSYGDAVLTFLKRAKNATLDMAAKILGLHAATLPRNTHSEMFLPICFRGIGVSVELNKHFQ